MEKNSQVSGGARKFGKAYRQGFSDGLALHDAVLEIGESWQPGSHARTCQCLTCEVTGRAPDRLAESWVFNAALDYSDGSREIANEVAQCGAIQGLLDEGDYPEAIIRAADFALRYASLMNDMGVSLQEEQETPEGDEESCDDDNRDE